jgi:hypothetical protein
MIIKDKDGALHHLKGSVGGFYYPAKITSIKNEAGTDSGLFEIKFAYSQENPINNTATIGAVEEDDVLTELFNPTNKIILKIPEVDTQNNVAYSIHQTLSTNGTIEQPFLTKGDTKIRPIVYCYLNGERVYFPSDYSISENGNFIIENLSAFDIDCEVR